MNQELRPALLILTKGKKKQHLFFYDHNDAVDTAVHFKSEGWSWSLKSVDVFQPGQTPLIQKRLL